MRKAVIRLMILFVLTGCTRGSLAASPAPPLPTLTTVDKQVPAFQSSYCWKSEGKSSCVDFIPPLLQVRNENPVTVPSHATIAIHFDKKPNPGTLQVNEWIGENKTRPVVVKDSAFVLPADKGIHVYSFFAEWEEGSAYYVCKVYVQ